MKHTSHKAEEYTGIFQRIVWQKDDGSFLIAVLQDGTSIIGSASGGSFIQGVEYLFSGRWENHNSYGKQFRFTSFVANQPRTDGAIQAYLTKYLFGKGTQIGPVKVRKLLAEVGAEKCLNVLKTDPKTVCRITGVSMENAKRAADMLIEVEIFETTRMQLVNLFQGRGFSMQCIDKAIEDFGVCAMDRIRRDPFTMLVRKYPSAGFLRCDQLYTDLGLPQHRLKRQTICLWHQIQKASGSVWISAEKAATELGRMVSSSVNPKKAIRLGLRAKLLSVKKHGGELWLADSTDAIAEAQTRNISLTLRNGYRDDGSIDRKPERSSQIA